MAQEHVDGTRQYHHLIFACGHNDQFREVSRFFGPLGRLLYHTLLGKVLKCHCGLPFASVQHLASHYKTCVIGPDANATNPTNAASATDTGPSTKSWFVQSLGMNHDYLDFSVYSDQASWMIQTVFTNGSASNPKLEVLGLEPDVDIAHCCQIAAATNGVVIRDDDFATISWTSNKYKSVDHWTRQRRELFKTPGGEIIMTIRCSSRVFSLVSSEATSDNLEQECYSGSNAEHGSILSIQWSARLAGLIEEITYLFPSSKPVVAFCYDGFSPCLPLLTFFFYSLHSTSLSGKYSHSLN